MYVFGDNVVTMSFKNQDCRWHHSRPFSSPCHCWDGLGHQVIYRCENDLLVTITITIITITTITIPRVQKSLLVLLVFAQVVKSSFFSLHIL